MKWHKNTIVSKYIGMEENKMATEKLDARGLKCPQPILKVMAKIPMMNPGDILETSLLRPDSCNEPARPDPVR